MNREQAIARANREGSMLRKIRKTDLEYCEHDGPGGSWGVSDARGIYLCRVCEKCYDYKMAKYDPEVLENPGYQVDEPIEEE
tara:strand:- start:2063 stop:2308 length:246 start_codon:yes stop_codon:yes gene_type:complete